MASPGLPFADENISDLLNKIIKGTPVYPKFFSQSLRNLLQRLIEPNFRKRASLEEVANHPWIKE